MSLIFLTIALGIVSGISEGMVMHFPNIREHPDFYLYHGIDVLAYALMAWVAVKLWQARQRSWRYLLMVIGLAFLLWECREIGYNAARYNTAFAPYEHVFGLGIYISGSAALALHWCRLFIAVLALLIGGVR